MTRENAASKGRRYLTEGRLEVRAVTHDNVVAVCRGAGHQYRCGWNPADRWWCECPAVRRCSHLEALRLVVTVTHDAQQTHGAGAGTS